MNSAIQHHHSSNPVYFKELSPYKPRAPTHCNHLAGECVQAISQQTSHMKDHTQFHASTPEIYSGPGTGFPNKSFTFPMSTIPPMFHSSVTNGT